MSQQKSALHHQDKENGEFQQMEKPEPLFQLTATRP